MKLLFGYDQHDIVLLLMLVTSFLIMMQQEKVEKLQRFVHDPIFLINLTVVLAFSLWIIHFNKVKDAKDEDDKKGRIRLRQSLFLGILAFIIALCAAFELVVLPFWVVWVSSYYFNIH